MRVGMLCTRVGVEEKLLLEEFRTRSVTLEMIDPRTIHFRLEERDAWSEYDVVFDRLISFSQSQAILEILDGWAIPTVNNLRVVNVCGNKLATSVALEAHHVPTPRVRVAFTPEAALAAIEELGYPAVLKPAVGSWGRLLGKVNDRDAAEALLEHKATLGNYSHSIFYIQQYVNKKAGRDVRSFVVDGQTICAIGRESQHWITNTARGGKAANFPVTAEVDRLSRAAAEAVGGGVLAIDLLEDQAGNWLVNEVNHSMEFRNSIAPTGVNIPARMVDFVLQTAQQGRDRKRS
jgi:[lysine-biosynthesis-protein LysW]---L-2-aminoadipate ligase